MAWLVMALLVTAAAAAQDNASNGAAATGDEYCIYTQGSRTDTPEIGPLPCDTSRPYMIGHSGLGSGPASAESPEPTEGTLASPPTPNANTDRSPDIEAP